MTNHYSPLMLYNSHIQYMYNRFIHFPLDNGFVLCYTNN